MRQQGSALGVGPPDILSRPSGAEGQQVLALFPGQGGFVEFIVPEAGHYPSCLV